MSFLSRSEINIYARVVVFGMALFALFYWYTTALGTPGVLNKSSANTSIVLIGLSMWLSSLSYFFNRFDSFIKYRKHLGLIGFAFGVTHFVLSFSAFKRLLVSATWESNAVIAPLTGLLALAIFTLMALISNRTSMTKLGVLTWRGILRTGYIAVLFVFIHTVMLKSARWATWYEGGMMTPPSSSLIVTVFMTVVLLMRLAMWWQLRSKK